LENRFQSLPFKCNLQRYTAGSTKNLLPGTAAGAGVQSSADPERYATTYPWAAAAGSTRTVGWHTVAFRGNASKLEILVDGRGLSLAYNRPLFFASSQLFSYLYYHC
jgi:hypothetical protein